MATSFSASLFSTTVYENLVTSDAFPTAEGPVVILGKTYNLPSDHDALVRDVQSKLWFTYRKGFSAIGGSGPTSDVGWGCMLRCGQMMLAQALVNRHLTRDWVWKAGHYEPKYFEIVRMFLDRKDCCYSIHQIASMGASEGKAVGEWFGPNTVIQVLRKLAVYDKWSELVIHVAMDNSVIIEDICKLCETNEQIGSSDSVILSKFRLAQAKEELGSHDKKLSSNDLINGSPGKKHKSNDKQGEENDSSTACKVWRPLLLVVPLRLGLTEINSTYFNAVKACLKLKQSVGIIGGKPSHAHWFIGYTEHMSSIVFRAKPGHKSDYGRYCIDIDGQEDIAEDKQLVSERIVKITLHYIQLNNRLFYLDPHTVQPFVSLSGKDENDESFHCRNPCSMDISELDPSIAVGFYCGSKEEFDDMCSNINDFITAGAKTPIFELHAKRPAHFPPIQPYCLDKISKKSATVGDKHQTDTDDEYEIL